MENRERWKTGRDGKQGELENKERWKTRGD